MFYVIKGKGETGPMHGGGSLGIGGTHSTVVVSKVIMT